MNDYMSEYVPAQTSVPDWLMTYSRQLADVYYTRKLNKMYVHMLQSFLAYEPWKANPPFGWKMARIHGSSGLRSRKGADPGWVPMNMVLPIALADQIKQAIEVVNMNAPEMDRQLSLRTFMYTAVCWWIKDVYLYKGPGMLED